MSRNLSDLTANPPTAGPHECTAGVAPQNSGQSSTAHVASSTTLRSIQRVPNECLLSIFRLAAAPPNSETVSNALLTKLMGVCLHWRAIIVGAPLLWTRIYLSCRIEFVRLCLERSGNADIKLRLPQASSRRTIDFSLLEPLLVPHHTRISHLDLNFSPDDQADAVSNTLTSALPALLSLTVSVEGGSRLAVASDRDRLPSLRCLKLHHVLLGTALHSVLPHLMSLALCDIRISVVQGRSHLATPVDILDLLELCTSLKTFTYIEGSTLELRISPDTIEVNEGRIVDLHSVERFCICGSLSMISGIMAHLSLPKNARAHFKVSDLDWDLGGGQPVLQAVLPANAARFFPSHQTLRHIAVSASFPREVVFRAAPTRSELLDTQLQAVPLIHFPGFIEDPPMIPSLCVVFTTPRGWRWEDVVRNLVANLLDEVSRGILPSPVETLVLQGPLHGNIPHLWRQILASLSEVGYLEISSTLSSMLSVLVQMIPLATSETDPDMLIPCPRLSELVLTCEDILDQYAWAALSAVLGSLLSRRSAQGCRRLDNLHLTLQHGTLEPRPAELEPVRTRVEPQVGNLTISYRH